MKPPKPPDVVEFAKILNEERVEWVLVGGMAMTLHGGSHVTVDIDIAIAKDSSNSEAWSRAFKRLGAKLKRGTAADWDDKLLSAPFLEFDSGFGPFHLLNRLPGIESFAQLRKGAAFVKVKGTAVPVASLDDLITMKSRSSRPKDKAHLLELAALKKLEREG